MNGSQSWDAAERRRAERELRESERRFREMLETVSLIAVMLDTQGNITFCNDFLLELTGWRREEIVGQNWFDRFIPPGLEVKQMFFETLARNIPFPAHYENEILTRHGERRLVSWTNTALRDLAGDIVGVASLGEDITKRRQAEEALRLQRDIAVALSSTSELARAMEQLLEMVLQLPGLDSGGIYLVDRHTGALNLIVHRGLSPQFIESASHFGADAPQTRLAMAGRPIYRRYAELLPEAKDDIRRGEGLRVLGVVPVQLEGQTIAVINIASHAHEVIPTPICDAVEAIAAQLGGTLARVEAEQALRESERSYWQRSAELQALYDISLRLNMQLETSGLLNLIVEQAVMLMGTDAGCLYIYDPRRGELTMSVATGYYSEFVGQAIRPGEGLAGRVFSSRRSMVVDDYSTWPGRAAAYDGESRFKATLAVPLLGASGVLGVLDIGGSQRKQAFDEYDVQLAELFAAQASVALESARLHAEAQRRAMELAALNKAGQVITSTLNQEEMLSLVMAEIKHLLAAEGASVLLLDPTGRELTFAAVAGPSAEILLGKQMPATAGAAGWVVQHKRAVLMDDAQRDARLYSSIDTLTGLTTRSLLAVPLLLNERVVGVVEAINPYQVGAFTDHDLEMLEVLAGSIVVALENARLFSSLDREKERLELLYELGRQLAETLDVYEVAYRALDGLCSIVGALYGVVRVCEPAEAGDGHILKPAAAVGYPRSVPDESFRLRLGEGLAGWVAARRETAVVDDVTKNGRWKRVGALDDEVRSAMCVPLVSGDELVGVLTMASTRPGFFDRDTCRLVESAAGTVAVAIANARLFQREREQFHRLQQSQAQLVHAEKMSALGQLAASIAHEINNPLQAVQGNLELVMEELEGDARSARLKRYLDVAGSEVERVAGIVRRMREFYRAAREERQPTDVHAALDSMLALAGKRLQHSRIVVEREWADGLPLIWANPDHLKQVFLNLVLNAIDAMAARGGTLRVRTALDQIVDSEGTARPAVRLEFSDTGEGMSPDVMAHLFEPFFTTKAAGTGLGLSISSGIIEAHKGQISATSQVGVGTTFVIRLPVGEG